MKYAVNMHAYFTKDAINPGQIRQGLKKLIIQNGFSDKDFEIDIYRFKQPKVEVIAKVSVATSQPSSSITKAKRKINKHRRKTIYTRT